MPAQFPIPRKRRTRQHVIADQSVNHLERYVIDAGFTAERTTSDYGYDLQIVTFDEDGFVEPGSIWVQLKASETLSSGKAGFPHDLDLRDYHLWRVEPMPVILVLFEATTRRAYWVYTQGEFRLSTFRPPRKGAKTVRVGAPKSQRVNHRAVAAWRRIKQYAIEASKP